MHARPKIAIIGAGVIGSALAMALAEGGVSDVFVYDFDLEGVLSSSELNAGGVRATFYQPLNIECARLSIEYFSAHAAEVGYRDCGYLWMVDSEGLRKSERSFESWRRANWPFQVWNVKQLQNYAPFIDKVGDLVGAVFSPRDGLLNPNLLKLHFRNRARDAGATFVDRHLLRSSEVGVKKVDLEFERFSPRLSREEREEGYLSLEDEKRVKASEAVHIQVDQVVNCAGPWAKDVARMLGYSCPSYNVRRQISLFDAREIDLSTYGMMVDPTGVYFHPEAGYILGGIAEREEAPGQNFSYSGESYFQEKIWLPLSERSTKFEALRHRSGWGGLYEISPDESAIIGEVQVGAPRGTGRVFESHSYSGHGVMQSYACGVALAEKMIKGQSTLFDLEAFAGSRFEKNRLLHETAVI